MGRVILSGGAARRSQADWVTVTLGRVTGSADIGKGYPAGLITQSLDEDGIGRGIKVKGAVRGAERPGMAVGNNRA